MNAETHHETSPDLRTDRDYFLARLELAGDDPHESLILMQEALTIDIAERVGFYPGSVQADPELVRDTQLSADQYERIMSLGELVRIYIEHGTYTPARLGGWLNALPVAMVGEKKRPIDMLFEDFGERGFRMRSLVEVSEHARAFLKESGQDAVWARWGD